MRVASMSSAALRREVPPGKPRAVIIPETRPPPGHAYRRSHPRKNGVTPFKAG